MVDKSLYFSSELVKWYDVNFRDLPWRRTKNPYYIWLSEIILQQTRVDQGMAYYLKFIDKYPEIKDLALASEEAVLKDWQGLGYYSRARNLHQTAKFIHSELNGKFPSTYEKIKSLKGIGEYTAAAISSFAFRLPEAVVDGNVYRVLSRYFGISTPIDSSLGKKEFQKLAQKVLDIQNPDKHNQAIMEFGALQCKPKLVDCENCCLKNNCVAKASDLVEVLPIKSKKTKTRNRFFNYLIIQQEDELLLKKRVEKDIWQNLHDFPCIENDTCFTEQVLKKNPDFLNLMSGKDFIIEHCSESKKHLLSHQVIQARFFHIRVTAAPENVDPNIILVPKKSIHAYAVPKLIENYLNEESKLLSLFHS